MGKNFAESLYAVTCDNVGGSRSGKQHLYKGTEQGNKSLCGKFSVLGDDGEPMEAEELIEYSESRVNNICKTCLKIWEK